MSLPVRFTSTAFAKLRATADYLIERNPQAAEIFGEKLENIVDQVSEFPLSGEPGPMPDTREIVMPRFGYRFIYQAFPERIVIVAVVHGRENFQPSKGGDE